MPCLTGATSLADWRTTTHPDQASAHGLRSAAPIAAHSGRESCCATKHPGVPAKQRYRVRGENSRQRASAACWRAVGRIRNTYARLTGPSPRPIDSRSSGAHLTLRQSRPGRRHTSPTAHLLQLAEALVAVVYPARSWTRRGLHHGVQHTKRHRQDSDYKSARPDPHRQPLQGALMETG